MFIVFEGIDGSGKDSIAQAVTASLKSKGYRVSLLDKKNPTFNSPFIQEKMLGLRSLIFMEQEVPDILEMDKHYWMLLTAAWFTSLYKNLVERLLSSGEIVIVPGWYYKLMARYVLKGCDLDWLEMIFSQIPSPTQVFLLDDHPNLVWHRRSQFSNIELGRLDGYNGNARQSFISYQEKVKEILLQFAHKWNWESVGSPDVVEQDPVLVRATQVLKIMRLAPIITNIDTSIGSIPILQEESESENIFAMDTRE